MLCQCRVELKDAQKLVLFYFLLGNKSCSGSVQSLTSLDAKETPKAPENPDLPPKMGRRLRLDTSSSNGYQRPGSV